MRRFVVSINPTVDDLNTLRWRQLQREVSRTGASYPEGYTLSYEGEYEAQAKAKRTILITSAIVLLVISFLLYSYFRNFAFVLLVFTIVPISLGRQYIPDGDDAEQY